MRVGRRADAGKFHFHFHFHFNSAAGFTFTSIFNDGIRFHGFDCAPYRAAFASSYFCCGRSAFVVPKNTHTQTSFYDFVYLYRYLNRRRCSLLCKVISMYVCKCARMHPFICFNSKKAHDNEKPTQSALWQQTRTLGRSAAAHTLLYPSFRSFCFKLDFFNFCSHFFAFHLFA